MIALDSFSKPTESFDKVIIGDKSDIDIITQQNKQHKNGDNKQYRFLASHPDQFKDAAAGYVDDGVVPEHGDAGDGGGD